jgi:cytochrome P450
MAIRKPQSATRTILNLALQNESEPLSPQLLQLTISQTKTFIFAGADTTATTMQWVTYLISKNPSVLAKLRAEHDVIFGDRPVEEVLAERPKECLSAMVYTTAVIKETLRLNPPAGSVRSAPAGSGFAASAQGMRMRLDGTMLFVNHHIIQRDEKVGKEKPHSTATPTPNLPRKCSNPPCYI